MSNQRKQRSTWKHPFWCVLVAWFSGVSCAALTWFIDDSSFACFMFSFPVDAVVRDRFCSRNGALAFFQLCRLVVAVSFIQWTHFLRIWYAYVQDFVGQQRAEHWNLVILAVFSVRAVVIDDSARLPSSSC